jgi:lipopolysaccharide transport system ATP-binding protein
MPDIVIKVQNLSKKYTLGAVHTNLLSERMGAGIRSFFNLKPNTSNLTPQASNLKPDPSFWALSDVSFEVKQGEVIGIIGRNGAGKSTLLKILSKITSPTSGRVEMVGRVASLLEVGTGFHPELTGRENIFLNGAILGMSKAEIRKKFDEIVGFAEVEKFIDTPVKRYSSGMYVRLAFSVAAHLEPEILIVDEVLAVGDAQFQKKCLGKMGDVAKEGRTILFVSHNMSAIEKLCTIALHIESGALKRFDRDVVSVVREYLHDKGRSLESEWVNSDLTCDSEWLTPHRLSITAPDGTPASMPVRNDQEIYIRIEGEIKKYSSALTIGYALYDEEGELLYWSYQTDAVEERQPKLTAGIFKIISPLPRRLLNEGTYRIEFIAGIHYQQWLFEPMVNAPSVCLVIKGGLSDSPFWMARRPGRLAPVIEWRQIS